MAEARQSGKILGDLSGIDSITRIADNRDEHNCVLGEARNQTLAKLAVTLSDRQATQTFALYYDMFPVLLGYLLQSSMLLSVAK
jgi:hypothetical protein